MNSSQRVRFFGPRTIAFAIILSLVASILAPYSVFAASIGISVTPTYPFAVKRGNSITSSFNVLAHTSTASYAVWRIMNVAGTTIYACKFIDMANGIWEPYWNNNTAGIFNCNGIPDQSYENAGNIGKSDYYHSGFTWTSGDLYNGTTKIRDGLAQGQYQARVDFYAAADSDPYVTVFESYGGVLFYVADNTITVTLQKFEDNNADGFFNSSDSNYSDATKPFYLCIQTPYSDQNNINHTCVATDSSGQSVWAGVPSGLTYTFYENSGFFYMLPGWRLTTATSVTATPIADYNVPIGNVNADMACGSVALKAGRNPSTEKMTFRLNFSKYFPDFSLNPTVQLYFSSSASPAIDLTKLSPTIADAYLDTTNITSSVSLIGGDGSKDHPYVFQLPTIQAAGPITGYVDVTVIVHYTSSTPITGSLVASEIVGSTFEPVRPADDSGGACAFTIPYDGTAVTATSLVASPQASGVQLSWWADAVSAGWDGFQLQSKPHQSGSFTDVPGGLIPANLTPGGFTYTFLDTSAQTGFTDYRLVPVLGGVNQSPVLSLTSWYGKVFIPSVLK